MPSSTRCAQESSTARLASAAATAALRSGFTAKATHASSAGYAVEAAFFDLRHGLLPRRRPRRDIGSSDGSSSSSNQDILLPSVGFGPGAGDGSAYDDPSSCACPNAGSCEAGAATADTNGTQAPAPAGNVSPSAGCKGTGVFIPRVSASSGSRTPPSNRSSLDRTSSAAARASSHAKHGGSAAAAAAALAAAAAAAAAAIPTLPTAGGHAGMQLTPTLLEALGCLASCGFGTEHLLQLDAADAFALCAAARPVLPDAPPLMSAGGSGLQVPLRLAPDAANPLAAIGVHRAPLPHQLSDTSSLSAAASSLGVGDAVALGASCWPGLPAAAATSLTTPATTAWTTLSSPNGSCTLVPQLGAPCGPPLRVDGADPPILSSASPPPPPHQQQQLPPGFLEQLSLEELLVLTAEAAVANSSVRTLTPPHAASPPPPEAPQRPLPPLPLIGSQAPAPVRRLSLDVAGSAYPYSRTLQRASLDMAMQAGHPTHAFNPRQRTTIDGSRPGASPALAHAPAAWCAAAASAGASLIQW